jgi:hypothetical protein
MEVPPLARSVASLLWLLLLAVTMMPSRPTAAVSCAASVHLVMLRLSR